MQCKFVKEKFFSGKDTIASQSLVQGIMSFSLITHINQLIRHTRFSKF